MKKKKVKKNSKKKAARKAKKIIKKKVKKIVKKPTSKRKPVGEVKHFYDKICVAVIKFNQAMAVGEEVCFEGPHGDFSQSLKSMQFEHEKISKAKKGQEVGVKTKKPVKEGFKVYRV